VAVAPYGFVYVNVPVTEMNEGVMSPPVATFLNLNGLFVAEVAVPKDVGKAKYKYLLVESAGKSTCPI